MAFIKAQKKRSKLRIGLVGPSGAGKSYSALAIASGLGKRIAVIDTERGSASIYSDKFSFDVCELTSFHPSKYIEALEDAGSSGYDVIVIDSLSHAWMGKDGALELVDSAAKRAKAGNSFAAWREVTPIHNRLVDAILQCKAHVIITMRSKTEYVLEANDRGRQVPRKVGMAPVQREGLEYEFTVVGELDLDHNLVITKTRCDALDGQVIPKPGAKLGLSLADWLDGAPPAPEEPRPALRPAAPPAAHEARPEPRLTPPAAAPHPAEQEPRADDGEHEREAVHPLSLDVSPLTENLRSALAEAPTKADLVSAWALAGQARREGKLSAEELAELARVKDARKAALAPPPEPPPTRSGAIESADWERNSP